MCGITGFINKMDVGLEKLKKMNDTINYRGPDSDGYFVEDYNKEYQIGMAHKRLAIMDLSPLGHQPMFSEDENIVVVFNGEIYNFYKTKKELESKGYVFKSHSDTEVIVKAYQEWGIKCVEKFNGMFAISIYDKVTKDFYLIRDRTGVKPVYYYLTDNGLLFGSELKPMMEHPDFKKELDLDALSLYLYHGYITAPKSIFKNTFKLEPGKILKFNNGKIEISTYWSVEDQFKNRKIEKKTEEEWIKDLDDLLTDSIKDRMMSDVPLGAFLSGGIDSSLVVSIMQKISDKPVKTFTIGFEEPKYDEANYAKQVAKYLGTNHYELYLPIKKAEELIPKIPLFYDEPFADSSQLPTMLVSQLAREYVTVSLSGDGGDELFCGYGRYETILNLEKFIRCSKITNKIPLLKNIVTSVTTNSKYRQFFEITNENNVINSGYKNYLNSYKLLKNYKNKFNEKYEKIMNNTENLQEKNMLVDMITYLPDDIFTKVDRASMSVSLESRAPLVDDHRILEFSFSMPHDFKYKDGSKKYILKELLYRYLPKEMMDRPKKGFGIPIYDWLKTDLKNLVEANLDRKRIEKQGIFEWKEIESLLDNFFNYETEEKSANKLSKKFKLYKDGYIDRTIWNLLVFQMWYEKYMS